MECMVCDETYNKSTRSEITCRACGTSCCKSCAREYISSTIKDAHCMNCKSPWNRGFLVENLNKSFVDGKYKETRKKILFQREQARFPETMEHVERMKKRLVYNDLCTKLRSKRVLYQDTLVEIDNISKLTEEPIRETISKYMSKLTDIIVDIKDMDFKRKVLKIELEKEGILEKRKVRFIHACPKEG